MKMGSFKICRYILTMLTFCLSVPAMGQYVWIDSSNVRHYSDTPPPSSVPENRILKTPRKNISSVTYEPSSAKAQADRPPSIAASAKAPMTLAEKNADFQKRRMEQAEKEKIAEQKVARMAARCEKLQGRKRTLESGHRLARIDKKGEREYVSDEQRARELEEVNRELEQCR